MMRKLIVFLLVLLVVRTVSRAETAGQALARAGHACGEEVTQTGPRTMDGGMCEWADVLAGGWTDIYGNCSGKN